MSEESLRRKRRSKRSSAGAGKQAKSPPAKYPRHAVDKALRIPRAVVSVKWWKKADVTSDHLHPLIANLLV
jgi:hypothetical protein